jgi:hypothetical protein
MPSIAIHEPEVKEITRWTRKNGEVYYCVVIKEHYSQAEITLFISDLSLFISQLILTKAIESKCSM